MGLNLISLEFVVFFAVAAVTYYVINHRARWMLLLAASLGFYYLALPIGIVPLILTALFNYIGARALGSATGKTQKILFYLLIAINLLALIAYKILLSPYATIISKSFEGLILPIGLSFYIFTQMSYIMDVYSEKIKPEKHIGYYALYVSFFPKLVAGPIERAGNFLGQITKKVSFDEKRVTDGLKLILFGFFKKAVIVELMARLVNPIYSNVAGHTGQDFAIATVIYAFQIFYDFSAYTDIAIGGAKIFGFDLSQNFNLPYLAGSVREFWRRWHITLSSWFRDYLYIPLGGNRVPSWMRSLNVFMVFMTVGLWHGFTLTFLAWGMLHGFYIAASSLTSGLRTGISKITGLGRVPRISHVLSIVATFMMICASWVFFRANSIKDSVHIFSNIFNGWNLSQLGTTFGIAELEIVGAAILAVETIHYLHSRKSSFIPSLSPVLRWPVYLLAIWLIIMFLISGNVFNQNFIYARF